MKKLILLTVVFALSYALKAQVFNSDANLRKGGLELGLEPVIFVNGGNNFMFFVHGGYGIKSGIALQLHGGFGNENYFAADLKWRLLNHVSLTTGALYMGRNFGLKGALNLGIPIRSDIRLFTGADMNIIFTDNKTIVPFWIPVGIDIGLSKNMALILDAEIELTNKAYHVLGGGLVFYF